MALDGSQPGAALRVPEIDAARAPAGDDLPSLIREVAESGRLRRMRIPVRVRDQQIWFDDKVLGLARHLRLDHPRHYRRYGDTLTANLKAAGVG